MNKKQRAVSSILSNLFGKFANYEFPSFIQKFINNSYVRLLGLDMSEFLEPSSYSSLNKLFTRELKKPRDFDKSDLNFISPCDSFVTECGLSKDGLSYQIKGMEYKLKDLLKIADQELDKINNSEFINFYLSPKDYHRYHAPYTFYVEYLHYIPGKLYPVNNLYLNKKINLFIENERVILKCKTKKNKIFYMVFVGALNVGKMSFVFEQRLETNSFLEEVCYNYNNLKISKGDYIGQFEMGSTILLFFEKDFVELEDIKNKKVKFGDVVATLCAHGSTG